MFFERPSPLSEVCLTFLRERAVTVASPFHFPLLPLCPASAPRTRARPRVGRRLHSQNKTAASTAATKATPPTTPPAMAPACEFLDDPETRIADVEGEGDVDDDADIVADAEEGEGAEPITHDVSVPLWTKNESDCDDKEAMEACSTYHP